MDLSKVVAISGKPGLFLVSGQGSGKLVVESNEKQVVELNKDLEDTKDALRSLGFKVADIDSVLKVVGQEKLTSQQYLKKALQLLRK